MHVARGALSPSQQGMKERRTDRPKLGEGEGLIDATPVYAAHPYLLYTPPYVLPQSLLSYYTMATTSPYIYQIDR